MIRYLFIDIDNTILDFDAFVRKAMREGFAKYGLPAYEEWMYPIFCEINDYLWNKIEDGSGTLDDVRRNRWNMIFKRLGRMKETDRFDFDGRVFEEYFRASLHECTIPVDGAVEAIRFLSGNYDLYGASNGPYEQQIYRMKKAGLDVYFKDLFISEKIGASKPSAEFFEECIRQIDERGNVRKDEIMMIGDSLTADMDGAISFGLKTCYYDRTGKGACGRNVDLMVGSMRELIDIL